MFQIKQIKMCWLISTLYRQVLCFLQWLEDRLDWFNIMVYRKAAEKRTVRQPAKTSIYFQNYDTYVAMEQLFGETNITVLAFLWRYF